MTEDELVQSVEAVRYAEDERGPPDDLRRRNFRAGWIAAIDGKEYTDETLSRLTWQNLGYRLGHKFGCSSEEEIEWAFEVLARRYRAQDGN